MFQGGRASVCTFDNVSAIFVVLHMYIMISISDDFLFLVNCAKKKPTDKPVPNATLQVTGAVGWRREGLAYKKNEVI